MAELKVLGKWLEAYSKNSIQFSSTTHGLVASDDQEQQKLTTMWPFLNLNLGEG